MKIRKNVFLLASVCLGFLLTSCEKDETDDDIPADTKPETEKPTVYTTEATLIMAQSAVLNGYYCIEDKKEIIQIGFYLASHSNPSEEDTVIEQELQENGDSLFSCSFTGLDTSRLYYFRAFLVSSQGTTTGEELNFKTKNGRVNLSTIAPVELSASILLSGGEILENGGRDIIETGICWNTSENPSVGDNKIVSQSDSAKFYAEIQGKDGTTIYFRSYAITEDKPFYGNEFSHTFRFIVDKRDEKLYKYIQIGEQFWLADNMAWVPEKLCPADEDCGFWAANNGGQDSVTITSKNDNYKQYGVLYNFDQAMNACPEGWEIPTSYDWQELFDYMKDQGYTKNAGKALKAVDGWEEGGNGTDAFGFNALPTGYRDYVSREIINSGTGTLFWSETANAGEGIHARSLDSDSDESGGYAAYRSDGCTVRCVKSEK
jgi:uncharacterized protein (TIGR02145 family)